MGEVYFSFFMRNGIITAIFIASCILVILFLFIVFINFAEDEDKHELNEIKENILEQIKGLFCWDWILGGVIVALIIIGGISFSLGDKNAPGA